jgi:hypothetical protein
MERDRKLYTVYRCHFFCKRFRKALYGIPSLVVGIRKNLVKGKTVGYPNTRGSSYSWEVYGKSFRRLNEIG